MSVLRGWRRRSDGHARGQARVVGYLEAVLEEVLFETEMTPRPSGLSFSTEGLRSAWKMSSWNQHHGRVDREQTA